uniref:DDE Tnp4 domain-containing protein n=1 Tax=Nothobranchius furzeri TaxID=105023 RepID=A0A8C6K907_NOTFU
MSGCSVCGCQNRFSSSSGLKFYRIPKGAHPFQQNRRRLWLAHFISGKGSTDFFFTGLTTFVFDWLLIKITDSVEIICQKLTAHDHLLVVLMKLRLGLSNTDLAYRFNVSKTTISNICRSWIPAMSVILKPLIKWPSKGAVLKNMPKVFRRNFKRCRCIIDCTEMFISRPSNLTARAQTWSNYKHSNTIKYLIGITPAGAISFLSPGWGGRVSDKQITKDELAASGATRRIRHFTEGKKHLSAQEVDSSRQLSHVRIHVERVIGRWKNCKNLLTVIPVPQLNVLDDIVIVCAALTNLCKKYVKLILNYCKKKCKAAAMVFLY